MDQCLHFYPPLLPEQQTATVGDRWEAHKPRTGVRDGSYGVPEVYHYKNEKYIQKRQQQNQKYSHKTIKHDKKHNACSQNQKTQQQNQKQTNKTKSSAKNPHHIDKKQKKTKHKQRDKMS